MRRSTVSYYLRRDLPFWMIGLLTCWLPDNPVVCRIRGLLAKPLFKRCGRNFQFGTRVRMMYLQNMEIGDNVYVAEGCWLSGGGGLVLHDEVMIGPYCIISTVNHRMLHGSARFAGGQDAPVELGRGSWLGAHSVVTAGNKVGSGVIVGANAVVTKSVPDHKIVGGVPAQILKDTTDSILASDKESTEARQHKCGRDAS